MHSIETCLNNVLIVIWHFNMLYWKSPISGSSIHKLIWLKLRPVRETSKQIKYEVDVAASPEPTWKDKNKCRVHNCSFKTASYCNKALPHSLPGFSGRPTSFVLRLVLHFWGLSVGKRRVVHNKCKSRQAHWQPITKYIWVKKQRALFVVEWSNPAIHFHEQMQGIHLLFDPSGSTEGSSDYSPVDTATMIPNILDMYTISKSVENPTLDEHLSSLDVELLWGVSGLSCTLQDRGSRLRSGRAGHRQGLGPLKGFSSMAAQLHGSPLSDRNCVGSKFSDD